jgi:hypothetical protein
MPQFDSVSGTLPNGGKYYTAFAISTMETEMPGGAAGVSETAAAAYLAASGTCYAAAHALLQRVNTALTAATGSVAGTMASGTVATLSGAYSTALLAGL